MKEHSNDRDKAEQSAHQRKNRGKGRAKRVWGVIGTIVLVGVLTMAIFVGIFMTYINKSLKGHVEVDMSEYDRKVSTELYRLGTDGETWEMYQTLFSDENRIWVDIGDIPEYLQEATIAIEDKRFKTHHGVDWKGTLRAITSTLTGSGTQGGSTITQQLLKNVTGDNQGTVKRKVTEIYRALALEKDYSKSQILEMYLNTIYLGEQCYGVQTAARMYFHKDVKDLTLAECAYEIGADRWIDIVSDRLGEEGTAGNMTLYLDEKALRADAPEREKTRNYTFDPATPVESIGGEALLHTMPQIGSHLQSEPDYREDVLSFVSEPLEETFTLNGKASVRLFVESDCEDTAFTAKIMEVTPEGKAYNIRSSIATLEQGKTEAGAYEPGSVAEVQITMWNIVYTIPKGSRIRVDVSSSDFPQYHVHSNQKGLWSEKTENKIAHQTIHMGRKAASCVILPLMKKQ